MTHNLSQPSVIWPVGDGHCCSDVWMILWTSIEAGMTMYLDLVIYVEASGQDSTTFMPWRHSSQQSFLSPWKHLKTKLLMHTTRHSLSAMLRQDISYLWADTMVQQVTPCTSMISRSLVLMTMIKTCINITVQHYSKAAGGTAFATMQTPMASIFMVQVPHLVKVLTGTPSKAASIPWKLLNSK